VRGLGGGGPTVGSRKGDQNIHNFLINLTEIAEGTDRKHRYGKAYSPERSSAKG